MVLDRDPTPAAANRCIPRVAEATAELKGQLTPPKEPQEAHGDNISAIWNNFFSLSNFPYASTTAFCSGLQ
jgi:hypothetical protein